MAYNYGSSYAGTGSASGLSSYSSRHSGAQDPYIPQSATISSSRYHASDSDASKYSSVYVPQSSSDIAAAVKVAASAQASWGDKLGSASVVDPSSVKRLSESKDLSDFSFYLFVEFFLVFLVPWCLFGVLFLIF